MERPVSQDVAERPAAALAALNAVPTADGTPRVIVQTAGFRDGGNDGNGAVTPPADTAAGDPEGGNGHDSGGGADHLEIPAFLRRS